MSISQSFYRSLFRAAALSLLLFFASCGTASVAPPSDTPDEFVYVPLSEIPDLLARSRMEDTDKNAEMRLQAVTSRTHLSQVKRYESGDTQPSLEVLRKIALTLNISADTLLFDERERGPPDDLRMQFKALGQFSPNEKMVAKELLDSLILKHTANRLST